MNPYDEDEENDIEELAEKFKTSVEDGIPAYFDNYDLQDVIAHFLELGEFDYGYKAIQQGFSYYPQDPFYRLLYSKYFSLQARYAEAERELDYMENNYTPIPEMYIERVLLAQQANQTVDNMALLQRSLELDDTIPEAHLLLTVEYLTQDNVADAVAHAKRAIQLDEGIAEDFKILLLDIGNFNNTERTSVLRFFEIMTEELPLNGSMWCCLGLAYVNANRFEQAIDAFQFQISAEDAPFAYTNIAESYFALRDYTTALEYFKIAQEKCQPLAFNVQIGQCYMNLQQYDEALQYYIKADENDTLFALKYAEIVKVFVELGRLEDARAFLRMHVQNCPDDIDALRELLNVLDLKEDYDEAMQILRKMQSEFSYDTDFLRFLTTYCCHNQCTEIGFRFCEEYFDKDTVTNSIGYFLAALYFANGQVDLGAEHLENAINISPDNFYEDFLHIDPQMRNITLVANLIDQYGYDADFGYEQDTILN